MKEKLKETLDQIHAPKSLVEDTLTKLHATSETEKQIRKSKKQKQIVIRTMTGLAAAIVVLLAGKEFFTPVTDHTAQDSATESIEDGVVAAGDSAAESDDLEEFTFSDDKKGISEWKSAVELFEKGDEATGSLDGTYIVYETEFTGENEPCHLQILCRDAVLTKKEDKVVLSGTFWGSMTDSTGESVTSDLPIVSTTQFSSDSAEIPLEETDKDGIFKLELETLFESETDTEITQFIVDETGIRVR